MLRSLSVPRCPKLARVASAFALGFVLGPCAAAQTPAPPPPPPAELTVVGWNVESGGADLRTIAKAVADAQNVDLWGFSEVDEEEWAKELGRAAGVGEAGRYRYVLGASGKDDRLAIAYDSDRFELVRSFELGEINIEGKVRAPLVAQLRDRAFANLEFLFMVNHLYRGNDAGRHEQATLLNRWAKDQTLPIIAVGDYNFDYVIGAGDDPPAGTRNRDRGFDNLTEGGVFTWVRPQTLEPTVPSGRRRPPSVLDFVFVAGSAAQWSPTSIIIVRPGDLDPASKDTHSDHRPVQATFDLPGTRTSPAPTANASPASQSPSQLDVTALRSRIDALEKELESLRAQLRDAESARPR